METCICSMAQHANPNVIHISEPDRAQVTRSSNGATKYPRSPRFSFIFIMTHDRLLRSLTDQADYRLLFQQTTSAMVADFFAPRRYFGRGFNVCEMYSQGRKVVQGGTGGDAAGTSLCVINSSLACMIRPAGRKPSGQTIVSPGRFREANVGLRQNQPWDSPS